MSISPAVLETVGRLVAFDSTSRKSNLDLIDYLKHTLSGLGAECRLTHDDSGKKANLYATLGPTDRPGVMLSGHTDVVPVEGQAWTGDPCNLTERDGKLFGRGSADMKSFIALAVALAPEFHERGLETPLHFAFSYDEEVGCIGVRRLIADLADLPIKPRLCIVGEPTGMKVVAGHKGKRNFSCTVHGKECHSALAEGVNAVEAAAEMIAHIKGMAREIRRDGPFDPAYEPPYTTLHTGIVEGGKALNIVPAHCKFEFEIRALPHQDVEMLTDRITGYARDHLEPEMKAVHPAAGFDFTIMNDTDGFDLPDDHEVVRLGFIEQAHKPDEFISLDQLAQGEAFLRRLMNRLCE
jgi:acetylornithine deacetylase